MKKETMEVRFVNRHRIDIESLKEIGFKEIEKMPTRIRSDIEDDMRKFQMKIYSEDRAEYSNRIHRKLEEMGYSFSDEVELGKKAVGFYRYVEREYTQYIWK
ncbi:MAG: hypothetical protein JEZ14_15025 [Marinilabiliaceae bacterium]|nr:hypothetical protein [Marinilabiliaceae bacterium]